MKKTLALLLSCLLILPLAACGQRAPATSDNVPLPEPGESPLADTAPEAEPQLNGAEPAFTPVTVADTGDYSVVISDYTDGSGTAPVLTVTFENKSDTGLYVAFMVEAANGFEFMSSCGAWDLAAGAVQQETIDFTPADMAAFGFNYLETIRVHCSCKANDDQTAIEHDSGPIEITLPHTATGPAVAEGLAAEAGYTPSPLLDYDVYKATIVGCSVQEAENSLRLKLYLENDSDSRGSFQVDKIMFGDTEGGEARYERMFYGDQMFGGIAMAMARGPWYPVEAHTRTYVYLYLKLPEAAEGTEFHKVNFSMSIENCEASADMGF